MKKTILLFLCSILMAGFLAAQDFYFDTTKAPLVGRFEATENANSVLGQFRKNGYEVVHIMRAYAEVLSTKEYLNK